MPRSSVQRVAHSQVRSLSTLAEPPSFDGNCEPSRIFVGKFIHYRPACPVLYVLISSRIHYTLMTAENIVINERQKCPLDIGSMSSLRKIFIHSYGSFQTHGVRLLKPLRDILSGSSVENSEATIRIVELVISWGSIPLEDEGSILNPQNEEWRKLDIILAQSSHFRYLDRLSIRFSASFQRDEHRVDALGPPRRHRLVERMTSLFEKVARIPKLNFTIDVETFVV